MGVMQFIAVVILYLENIYGLKQAHVLAIALSVISVVSIDINIEALQKKTKFSQISTFIHQLAWLAGVSVVMLNVNA